MPREALRGHPAKARFDVARIDAIEREVQHDVIAFVSNVAENVGPEGRWLHYGLTSSDVVDTALSHADARRLRPHPRRPRSASWPWSQERAFEHKHTPMIGRTHGVHAEPMTFGLKLALWYAELQRDRARLARARDDIAVGKLSGAVGTFSHLPPEVEEAVCARLGLRPAPVASQVLQRDRHAEVLTTLALLAASLEKFATEIRALQKTEVREVEEPFGGEAEGLLGHAPQAQPGGLRAGRRPRPRWCARNALAALENVALWHERDISHSSVERVIVPDSFLALDHMLRRFTEIVRGHDRERRAHAAQPRVRPRARLLGPAPAGADGARACVARTPTASCRRHAMEAWKTEGDFRQRVADDPEIRARAERRRDRRGLPARALPRPRGRDLRARVRA